MKEKPVLYSRNITNPDPAVSTRPTADRIDFLSPAGTIPGIGPRRVAALAAAGITTLGELLCYYPRRYLDRSICTPIAELEKLVGQQGTVGGTITATRVERGSRTRLRVQLSDGCATMEAIWFSGIAWLRPSLQCGKRCLLSGNIGWFKGPQMVHPHLEFLSTNPDKHPRPYLPRYRTTLAMKEAGIGQKVLMESMEWTLQHMRHYPRVLPPWLEADLDAPSLESALNTIHFPSDPDQLPPAYERVVCERLYTLALILRRNRDALRRSGRSFRSRDLLDRFLASLPFTLTPSQHQALETLTHDAASVNRMHRMLQGDVGCGKTVVACAATLPALEAGYQIAWMAPTEILAYQSWKTLRSWLEPMGLSVALLCGATRTSERRAILNDLRTGSLHIVIATQALLNPKVQFHRLGMVVIDEQHRFGIEQRRVLLSKDSSADVLLMSATPIPHSLAQTVYGDLDLVTIQEGRANRPRLTTHLVPQERRSAFEQFLRTQVIEHDAQVYYVVPRVEQSDDEEQELAAVETTLRRLSSGPLAHISCALVHGGLNPERKQEIIDAFADGSLRVLVATTVVEVGIDSPNATIMVIEDAHCFGLSQLHQLRGRVGRGTRRSYCFLLASSPCAADAEKRIRTFATTSDGFALAEMDLATRGPGNTTERVQSGWDDPDLPFILAHRKTFIRLQRRLSVHSGE